MAPETVSASVLVCSFLMAVILLVAYVTKKYHCVYFPESASAMFLGMIFGSLSLGLNLDLEFSFSPEIFFYGLLPIIIFNAGYALKKKDFFRNFSTIILFAVVGTIISSLVYGLGTYALYQLGLIRMMSPTSPLLESLMFGSLISAIDPVATLSIFQDVQAPSMLYNLVFGESLVNDASSIVLFRTFESFMDVEFSLSTIGVAILWFCAISVGSIVLGVLVSLGCALVLKYIDIRSEFAKFELAFILLSAYMSYSVAEIMGLSGIMSLFFCGICNAHYGYYNTSHASKISSKYAFEALSFLSELFVFAYLGMQVVVLDHVVDFGLIASAIPLCLISRAVNIFPLSWLANKTRKKPITSNMKVMMWLSGLRGAIAYALSVNMPTDNRAIETTTLFVVVFTTVIFGASTGPSLRLLGLTPDKISSVNDQSALDVPLISGQSLYDLVDRYEGWGPPSGFHRGFKWFDQTYMKPIFGGQADRGLELGAFADEDDHRSEGGNIVWVEHIGFGFSLHVPQDWEESLDTDLEDDSFLAKLSSPEKAEGEGEPAATVAVTIHAIKEDTKELTRDGIECFGEPMDFLTRMWDELDLDGRNALSQKIQKAQKAAGILKSFYLNEGSKEGSRISKRVVGSLPLPDSSSKVSANNPWDDPAGINYSPRSLLQLKSEKTVAENLSRSEAEEDENLSRCHKEENLTSSLKEKGDASKDRFSVSHPSSPVPAFVMWAEQVNQNDQLYYHYEVVLHPEDLDLHKAHIRHIFISLSSYAGAIYVCRVDAIEKWAYGNGVAVGRQMIESFKVGVKEAVI